MPQMISKIVAAALLSMLCVPAVSQELTIAAAADLRPALEEISTQFQAESGARVRPIYGSSGSFYQQIQNGAPFDLFLSANAEYPKKLEAAGLTIPGTYYEYARGKIVLLAPADSKLPLADGLKVLLDPAVKKIAIADPSHAPYGQAAVATLKAEHLYDAVAGKIVSAENISQAASFVLSGAADVGIVALSLAMSPQGSSKLRYAGIPAEDYPAIQQACLILRSSKNQALAARFEEFLRGEAAKAVFSRFGFEVPSLAQPKK